MRSGPTSSAGPAPCPALAHRAGPAESTAEPLSPEGSEAHPSKWELGPFCPTSRRPNCSTWNSGAESVGYRGARTSRSRAEELAEGMKIRPRPAALVPRHVQRSAHRAGPAESTAEPLSPEGSEAHPSKGTRPVSPISRRPNCSTWNSGAEPAGYGRAGTSGSRTEGSVEGMTIRPHQQRRSRAMSSAPRTERAPRTRRQSH
jgi:hypothetical protein